ncbi:phage tail family protein [Bacillaceae bacterium Marseille-Q3522]|nr:phage tail family protein [Bacillaceae bacterium Marseille-Q3522]
MRGGRIMLLSFSFNGIKKTYMRMEPGRRKSVFSPVRRNLLRLPGMVGAYLDGTDTDVLVIQQPISIEGKDKLDLRKVEEDLAAWLVTEQEAPLIFDDEPGRVYYAVIDGSFEPEQIVNFGRGTINFICPKSRKFALNETVATFANAGTFEVGGTAKTEPVIDVHIKSDTTFVAVSDGEGNINMVGMPNKVEETPADPLTKVMQSYCNTTTGWTAITASSVEFGDLMGQLKTNGDEFYTDDYGTSTRWHGPGLKTGLSEAVQDFQYEAGFGMRSTPGQNQAGSIEVSVLDANNTIVSKFTVTKHFGGSGTLYGRIRAKNHDIIGEDGPANSQNNWGGVFRVKRKGNVWTAEIWPHDGLRFHLQSRKTWVDTEEIAAAPITQLQVRFFQRAAFPLANMNITDIIVYRQNDLEVDQVPILAHAGDIVTFDHTRDIILRNGEDITREKAFIGSYFPLKPGANTIVVEPAEAIESAEVRWRDEWF